MATWEEAEESTVRDLTTKLALLTVPAPPATT